MMGTRSNLPKRRFFIAIFWCSLVFLAALLTGPLIGTTHISLWQALSDPQTEAGRILFVARLPRVLLGLVAGASLAAAGVTLQALLRNALATPYTLGVSSGAALGAVVAIFFGLHQTMLGFFAPTVLALAFAIATSAVVYFAASRPGRPLATPTLLLAGVCLAFCLSAIVMLLHYLADMAMGQTILRWLLGGLAVTNFTVVVSAAIPASVGLVMMAVVARDLNVLSGGEEIARSRGVDVARTQRIAYLGASLATASVVSVTGPIGFVGLVVPHALRLIFGPDHRTLIPCAALVGGAFLVFCDGAARTVVSRELPVGVLTAIIGGPFLIWLLRREQTS